MFTDFLQIVTIDQKNLAVTCLTILTEEKPGFRRSEMQTTWSKISCLIWAPFYNNSSFVKGTSGRTPFHTFTFDGQLQNTIKYNKSYWVGDITGYKYDTVPGKHFFFYI